MKISNTLFLLISLLLALLLSLAGFTVQATEPMTEAEMNEYQATNLINKSWQLYRSQTTAESEQMDLSVTRFGEAAQQGGQATRAFRPVPGRLRAGVGA